MNNELKERDSNAEGDPFDDYDEYAKVLRTWLVAYGIGGPVLFLNNEAVRSSIAKSGHARCIAVAFLVGVGLQVLFAFFNKTALWLCYKAKREPKRSAKLNYRTAKWFADQCGIDFVADLLSLSAFACATWLVFVILLR